MKSLKIAGSILTAIQLIVSIVLIYLAMSTKFVPFIWGFIGSIILIAIPVALFILVFKHGKKVQITAMIFSGIFIVVISALCYYLGVANKAIDDVTGNSTEVDEINVYVAKDDAVSSVNEAVEKDYIFAIIETDDMTHIQETLDEIEKNEGKKVMTISYESIYKAVSGFENEVVHGIITNKGNINILDNTEEYKDYSVNKLKVIMENEIVEEVEVPEEVVDEDIFCVYVSGIDTFGSVTAKSRSDVNIIGVVNNKTKTVLLLSTPRDYYVKLAQSTKNLKNSGDEMKSDSKKDVNGKEDKLTHAGLYGIGCSMGTLEGIYDVDLNYYVRINFSGFQKIIDKLGGVDVNSQYAFTSMTEEGTYEFSKGINHLTGEEALGFARSRNFADGDRQRGKNQMQVIKATIEKLESSAMLKNYGSLMDELSDTFQTNMSKDDVGYLVQSTLENGNWNVLTYSVSGSDSQKVCYSLGTSAYVMVPNTGDIDYGNKLIKKVLNGEELKQEEIDEYIVNKDNEDLITEEKPSEEEDKDSKDGKQTTTE